MGVAVVLAARVVAVVARVGRSSRATSLAGGFQLGGATLSSHSQVSSCRPGSSSLTQTPAVMCMADDERHALVDSGVVDGALDVVGDPNQLAPLLGGEGAVDRVRLHGGIMTGWTWDSRAARPW